jgi:DNA invertase Pin-like site-specific DNA recombinase
VIGYIRVSTKEQATEGISLEAQEQKIRAYCALKDVDLEHLVIDAGVSAAKPLAARPGGKRLLMLAAAGKPVVAFKLDRLFRDCVDCLDVVRRWDNAGTALHLIDLGGQAIDTSSAMGRFFLTVMAGAAELERNLIGERTSAALQHLRAQGVAMGGAPYGFRYAAEAGDDGRRRLVAVDDELATLDKMQRLRDAGLSYRAVAGVLNDEHVPTKNGGTWKANTVRRILVRAQQMEEQLEAAA